jgi:hypothetical protein
MLICHVRVVKEQTIRVKEMSKANKILVAELGKMTQF